MSNINNIAKEYLTAGFSVIPTRDDKRPALTSWSNYQKDKMKLEDVDSIFKNAKKIAIVCGSVSGNLEVIDVDTKHDNTGLLWSDLKALLEDNLPELYPKLTISQTVSKGYHIYYRCSTIEGNKKLATKENREVLIETRGQGGYVLAPPSKGYNFIQGDINNIPTITPAEREIIFSISRSFNEIIEEVVKPKTTTYNSTGLSPFEDYNREGDVVGLLQSHGWKVVRQIGERVHLLRAGDTDSKSSGNFHTGLRVLRVFSSSTIFDPDKGYNPSTVFSLLECSGDNKEAYRKLLDLGYGEPYKGEIDTPKTVEPFVAPEGLILTGDIFITPRGVTLDHGHLPFNRGVLKFAIEGGATSFTLRSMAEQEIKKTVDLLLSEGVSRIYIEKDDNILNYHGYKLDQTLEKYGKLEVEQGELFSYDIDNLLDEVVSTASNLSPIHKELYIKSFISLESIKGLGITEESLSLTVDRIIATKNKDTQARDFKNLLSEATTLQDKGEVNKALELISGKVNDIKLQDKATEFSSLLLPIKQEELKQRLITKPESINSGYTIGGEDLLLPSGALTILAAPTSHGKTTFLINLALNTTKSQPEKEIYLFSYEEDSDSILINALNTYLNRSLSGNNRTTLKNHFSGVNKTTIEGKDKFFSELIDTNRLSIHYSNYTSDILIEAIRYLHKNTNVGAVFIDYIQLLNLPNGKYKTYSRQEEIKQICIALKDIAVETGLPIILGAQFNRTVQNQLQIHPTKIGEAGDIERIANLIIGFWNNRFKTIATDGERNEISLLGCEDPNTIYAEVLKNRGGRVGLKEVFSFNGNTGNISNMDKQVNTEIEF